MGQGYAPCPVSSQGKIVSAASLNVYICYSRDHLTHNPAGASGSGYDVVIMSDLLHFDRSHDVLIQSLASLLCKHATARAYVAAGKYTPPHVCDHFVHVARQSGIILEEGEVDGVWRGTLEVVSGNELDRTQLGIRKDMCRWWIGRWAVQTLNT